MFFQGFVDGELAPPGGDKMRRVLQPHVEREEPEHRFLLIRVGEDTTDVCLDEDHLMANHVTGERSWDLSSVEPRLHNGWLFVPGA